MLENLCCLSKNDEYICYNFQIKEIKALKKIAQDLEDEKQQLLQKQDYDAVVIARMSEEALAKEDQLARLRNSLEELQSGRPDASIISGANLGGKPKVGEDGHRVYNGTEGDDNFDGVRSSDSLALKFSRAKQDIATQQRHKCYSLKTLPHVQLRTPIP
jgi:hypothetical protein